MTEWRVRNCIYTTLVCLVFPVLIPVALGMVVYLTLSAALSRGTNDEM